MDPWFIVDSEPDVVRMIRAAMGINDSKPLYVIVQVTKAAALFKHSIIAYLSLAFKADMYNLR
jgi:UDP-N-acetyl-D-mannosaminuronic acid dehydrogenase